MLKKQFHKCSREKDFRRILPKLKIIGYKDNVVQAHLKKPSCFPILPKQDQKAEEDKKK